MSSQFEKDQTVYIKAAFKDQSDGTYSMWQGLEAGFALRVVKVEDGGCVAEFLSASGATPAGGTRSIPLEALTAVKPSPAEIAADNETKETIFAA